MIDPFEKTFAEDNIDKIPDGDGEIEISFIRVYPKFKVIKKRIPLGFLSKIYKQVYHELTRSGIKFYLSPPNVKVVDYHLFVRKIFPGLDVYDDQNNREGKSGRPDFRLCNKEGEFYIEFKKSYDNIRTSQLIWIGENPNKEVWFLILGSVDVEDNHYSD